MQKDIRVPIWFFFLLAILYLLGIGIDTMDVDASQYAEMSREMSTSSNPLFLYDRGNNYLDKPPFLFWVSALSIKLLGATNFGFKLPSILFALWALYATYRLALLLYDNTTASLSALVLGTCQGLFLMTNDIRTDTILMSWVITAIWMLKELEQQMKWKYLIGGALAIACGMMTKGPIALLVPIFCFGSDWVLKRNWSQLFHYRHLLQALLIGVFLIPMSIGLYLQFDKHPEIEVNGQTGVSGLKFFYWTQSFGRITGESHWDNGAPFSFLYENMLWSFLPWVVLFTIALVMNLYTLIRQGGRLRKEQEYITTGGFVLAYLSLALSKYQLPHYIFVVFPLAAIMTARLLAMMLRQRHQKLSRILTPIQYIISALLLVAALLTFVVVFKTDSFMIWLFVWVLLTVLWIGLSTTQKINNKIVWTSAAAIMIANVFMSLHFYPQLLKYQVGSQVGRYIKQQMPNIPIAVYAPENPINAINFYADKMIGTTQYLHPNQYLLTMKKGLDSLQKQQIPFQIIQTGAYFQVSQLTPTFLNPKTRSEAVKPYYILQLK